MNGPRDVVVIGGSAGAIESLVSLVARLPDVVDAALLVVIHTSPLADSMLPRILQRRGKHAAAVAQDGEPIVCGRIYVAPPDFHLLVEPGKLRLSAGPREGGHRPAIDPLFRTAANAYGERVIGVVLSGMLDDGSTGLRIVRRHGGVAMVQDPDEALFAPMPKNAIAAAHPQHVAPVAEIARLIATHAGTPLGGGESQIAMGRSVAKNGDVDVVGATDAPGVPTGIACPECHGVLWAATDEESPEFRCRVGHAYSGEALLDAHSASLDGTLWAGVRALEEQASLARHLARKAEGRGDTHSGARFLERARAAAKHATAMEALLLARMPNSAQS